MKKIFSSTACGISYFLIQLNVDSKRRSCYIVMGISMGVLISHDSSQYTASQKMSRFVFAMFSRSNN